MNLLSRISRIEAVSAPRSGRVVVLRAKDFADSDQTIASMRAAGTVKSPDTIIVTMWKEVANG